MPVHAGLSESTLALIADVPGVSLGSSAALFRHPGKGLPLLRIEHPCCEAVVALQGAQVLQFQPRGGAPLLWLSPRADFAAGVPIRGGIPVCLPWFGPHPQRPDYPKHGFGRLLAWRLDAAGADADGAHLAFELESGPATRPWAAAPFQARLELQFGHSLQLRLLFANRDAAPQPVSWAFHSYLAVADPARAEVLGLEGREYLDNTRGLEVARQRGTLRFEGEVDRVFQGVGGVQTLSPLPGVRIAGEGCDTVVVWNPGAALAAGLGDIGVEGARQFVCVERGAAFADAWRLSPGERRAATMSLAYGAGT